MLTALENTVPDTTEKCADIVSLILLYAMYNEKPYNVYRYSTNGDYFKLKTMLDDFITIIAYELYVDMLDEHGVSVTDYPSYDDDRITNFAEVGVQFVEEAYNILIDVREELIDILKKKGYDSNSSLCTFIEFLHNMKWYTDITSVIAKVYMVIYNNPHFAKADKIQFMSKYNDVLGSIHLDKDFEDVGNDIIYEYISEDIKVLGYFPMTYYEFINTREYDINSMHIDTHKGFKKIYERLLRGDDIDYLEESSVAEGTIYDDRTGGDIDYEY